jgi:hypothetical protein
MIHNNLKDLKLIISLVKNKSNKVELDNARELSMLIVQQPRNLNLSSMKW